MLLFPRLVAGVVQIPFEVKKLSQILVQLVHRSREGFSVRMYHIVDADGLQYILHAAKSIERLVSRHCRQPPGADQLHRISRAAQLFVPAYPSQVHLLEGWR